MPGTWSCRRCHEAVDESFDACWKCGATRAGDSDPSFAPVPDAHVSGASPEPNPITCVRCERSLDYVGRKRFHEGTNWGALGELGELFVKREHFDVYVCPRCGRVELFVDGIGEAFRPH